MTPPSRYQLSPDGLSYAVHLTGESPEPLLRTDHRQFTRTVPPDTCFNRGGMRFPTMLVTGDRPRFAMLRTLPEPRLDPDLIKLGDGRVRIISGGEALWLDECDRIDTLFHPGRTEHHVSSARLPGLDFHLLAAHAGNWGVVARLRVTNQGTNPVEIGVEWVYGGLRRCPRTVSAAYFPLDEGDGAGNGAFLTPEGIAFLTQESIPDQVGVRGQPPGSFSLREGKAVDRHALRLLPGETQALSLLAGHADRQEDLQEWLLSSDPDALIGETLAYYEALLYRRNNTRLVHTAGYLIIFPSSCIIIVDTKRRSYDDHSNSKMGQQPGAKNS